MFEWKVEDMKLSNGNDSSDLRVYVENTTMEDKIAFVDSFQEGKLSYILSLIEKFNEDKHSMPKNEYGDCKTVSLKAWVRKNDTRKIIDNSYRYGNFYIIGCERNIQHPDIKSAIRCDFYNSLIDEVFCRQLRKCRIKEREYFLNHDEYSILKQELRDKSMKYNTTFGVKICFHSHGKVCVFDKDNYDIERDITIDELKYLLSKYDYLDKLVEKITEETNIEY